MRVSRLSMGDLTFVNPLGLPSLGPNLIGAPTYSGGLTGLGQAACPSEEQLQGITDPNDPCQAAVAAQTAVQALPSCTVAAPGVPCSAPTVAPAASTGTLNISSTTIIAGIAVIAVVFAALMARR